jgi:phosphatidylserine/phosphatidylglycerophosphate/cardiolipin synthase-like enzyme
MILMRKQFIKRLSILILACYLPYFSVKTHSEAYFSPDDHITDRLIQVINGSKRKIYAAIYMFTDKFIAQALIDAKKRGVDVKMIVDNATMDYEYGKATLLKENGIDVYVFSTQDKNARYGIPIMHNKFALIDSQLLTGSFNWTKSADKKNQENIIITTNKNVYARFEKQFEVLKNRAVAIKLCKNAGKQKNMSDDKRDNKYNSEESSIWDAIKEFFTPPKIY